MPPLFPVTLALYAVACTLYLAHVLVGAAGSVSVSRAARVALACAFIAHAIDIGWLCLRGQHPVVDAREAVFFVAWLMTGGYLLATLRGPMPVVGALVAPVVLVLDVAARFSPVAEAPRAGSLLGSIHITLATAGVALFAVAAGGAVVYLVEERNLKAHRAGRLFRRGPALESLDRLNRRCISAGFPLFTLALVTGTMWVARLPGGRGFLVPEYGIAAATWLLYAGLLVARVTAGWRGRRAALVTLAGFATAMTVLLIYFVREVAGA